MSIRFRHFKTSPQALAAVLLAGSVAAVAAGKQFVKPHAPVKAPASAKDQKSAAMAQFASTPLSFEANRGQMGRGVDFVSRGPGYGVYIGPRGAAVVFAESAQKAAGKNRKARAAGVVMRLLGGNKNAKAAPAEQQQKKTNYLMGNNPQQWRRNVPNYGKVRYAGVYPGVDLVYYGNQRQLEYDFVVKPGADPKAIRLGFAGAKEMRVDGQGDLVLKTSVGDMRQHKPLVYQNIGGARKEVEGRYVVRGKREAGFQLAKYDATQPLIIDPVISWSTYVGGSLDDYAMGIAVNANGNAYVCGYTGSFDEAENNTPAGIDAVPQYPGLPGKAAFPTTGGAYMTSLGYAFWQDDLDANGSLEFIFIVDTYHTFVFEMNTSGSGLVYSTYLGSAVENEYATAIALDKSGNAYITGEVVGANFPRVRPLQAYNGSGDAFVVKLNADGNNALFSTYLGGNGVDVGRSIAVDADGNAIVTGLTTSTNLPVYNAIQPAPLSAGRHQWVANINIGGSALNYLTYLSGTNGVEGGDQFIESFTPYSGFSPDAIVDPKGNPPRFHSGRTFGTVAVQFSQDYASGVAVDALGNAYVTGATTSTTFPTTNGVYRKTKASQADQDIFLTKLSPFGQMVYSTYAGGSGNDAARGIALDGSGNAYVTGYTNSSDLLTGVSGGFQTTYNGGAHDAFVLKFNTDASALVYGTYIGGSGDDVGASIAVNKSGYAYVAGFTNSSNLPILNPVQGNLNSFSQDAFLAKLVPAGNGVEYLTYLGGNSTEWATGVAIDANDAALITGIVSSTTTFPVTLGAYMNRLQLPTGGSGSGFITNLPLADAFLTRITNPPVAPSNLRITYVDTGEIDLAWDDQSVNETGFEIERSPDGVNFTLVGAVGANVQTYQDKGLISNTLYYYRVRAVNSQGNSAYSNVVSITTLPSPPADPSNISAQALDQTRIQVVFTDGSNNESGFELERSLDGTTFALLKSFGPSAGSGANVIYVDGGVGSTPLVPNTKYYYRVRSYNTAGNSGYAGPANATTLPNKPTTAPTALNATPIDYQEIDLDWTYAVNPTDATGFKIYRSTDGINFTLYRVTNTPATTFADTGLPATTTYYYKVGSYNTSGDGPLSSIASAKTLPAPPANPANLQANVVSSTQIDLTWIDNSTTETDFLIERSVDGGATWPVKVYQPYPPSSATGQRTYSDTTVQPDNTYTYRVTADITVGMYHSLSKPAGPVTAATPPVAPTLTAVRGVNSSSVQVSFTDNSQSETAFKLQRSTNGGVSFQDVSATIPGVSGAPNAGTYTDTGAVAETTNIYRLFATNGSGSSTASNQLSIIPLAAPTSVQVTATGQKTVNITFVDNSSNELGYKAERSDDGGNTWTPLAGTIAGAGVLGGTASFSDSGLMAATTYTWRVWAYTDTPQAESDRASGTGTTLPNPPAAPSLLTVAPGTQTTLNITFTDNADNEDGFVLERSTNANAGFAQVGANIASKNGTGGVITLTDTGLIANTTYYYRVKAFNTGGSSAYAGPVSATTLPNPPTTPSGVTATLTAPTTITLTFTDTADNEDNFTVQRSTDGGATFPITLPSVAMKAGTGGVVTVTDVGLATDATYTYRVRASNIGGDSAWSANASAPTAPAAPSNVTFTSITNKEIRVFWVNNSTTATQFKLYRSLDGGTSWSPLATVSAANTPKGEKASYLDSGLTAETTYTYRVSATNGAAFDSDFSSAASAKTLPNPPANPSNVTLTAKSQTRIDISFVDNSDKEEGFTVQRSTDGQNWVSVTNNLGASNGVGQTVTVSDSGLKANTSYFYRVQAFNAGGPSDWVTAGPKATLPNPPAAPTDLTVSNVAGSSTQLKLTWKDGSDNEDGFLVERATGNSGNFQQVASPAAHNGNDPVMTLPDSGLKPNTSYTYRVSAYNTGGSSSATASVTGLTLPATPTNVTAANNGNGTGIVVNWTAPTGGAASYAVEVKTNQPSDLGYHRVATVPGGLTSYTFTVLIPNVTFTFHVIATNAAGDSAVSNEASATVAGAAGLDAVNGPAKIAHNRSGSGTVTLKAAAPAGGATVALSVNNAAVSVPSSVTVPAGATTATFTISVGKVKKNATVTLTAQYAGTTRTKQFKITK